MSARHVTNGDHAAGKLRRFVDGPVTVACDVLHEGPCPPLEGGAWHALRAGVLAGADHGTRFDEIRRGLAETDAVIARDAAAPSAKLVLWFEHDLFDQLILIRTLSLMRPASADVRLICIGAFPGIDRFIGLGQLTVEQLATLDGTGVPVTADHYAIAAAAWSAFRSPDPRELLTVINKLDAGPGAPMPFLRDALLRLLAEYPSATNGLSRTETLALDALSAGEAAAHELFAATQAREPRPFLGDTTFFGLLRDLSAAARPLVALTPVADGNPGNDRVALAGAGRDVLAGRADHARLNGIDRWRGGVHLTSAGGSPWRWDSRRETLVR